MPEFMHALAERIAATRFSELMIASKWWWAFMMDLHFIGLCLLMGTIGLLDLRLLGFLKELPAAPFHRLVPWAILGFGINLVTGTLAFVGMPVFYTYDLAFWLKMGAIVLAGINVLLFYWTGVIDQVDRLGPGEDAPFLAKFMAGSSLVLWFAVLILGRYIQALEDSIAVR